MKSTIYYQYYDSPVGKLLLIANDKGLIGIEFEQEQLTSDAQKWQKANETSGQIFEIRLADFINHSLRQNHQLR